MNKMGIFQRLWCLMITIVLLLAAAGVYPEPERKAVQANGAGNFSRELSGNIMSSDNVNYKNGSVSTFGKGAGTEVLATGRATIYSHEAVTQTQPRSWPVSVAQPAATKTPQATSAPSARKKGGTSPAKPPASVPVAAPAREQIITSLKVTATGYTAGYESTGKTSKHPEYGITYSGVKVRRDKNTISTIAADPRVLPLGSILYVPGYGYAVVADTGSAIKGRKIDLYFATTKQVYKEWGKKTVVVQLIKRGNGKCSEAMLKDLSRAIKTYNSVPSAVLEEVI